MLKELSVLGMMEGTEEKILRAKGREAEKKKWRRAVPLPIFFLSASDLTLHSPS